MANSPEELERFKTEINLIDFALDRLGFELDQRRTSEAPASLRLRGPNDKIVVSRSDSGIWVYFSVHDFNNNGTIIDLVRCELSLSLGESRKYLRDYLGSSPSLNISTYLPKRPPLSIRERSGGEAARRRITKTVERMPVVTEHPYLQKRGIPAELLSHPHFVGAIRQSRSGSLIFPHRDQDGLCGYEYKGEGYEGFSRGGTKGLWLSNRPSEWQRLVLCESVIDALSFYLMFPWVDTQYAATAGGWGPKLDPLILSLVSELPPDGGIVAAFDHDKQGARYTNRIIELFEHSDYELFLHKPPIKGSDWNDMLIRKNCTSISNLAAVVRS